jgi:hypothetical protein
LTLALVALMELGLFITALKLAEQVTTLQLVTWSSLF